MDCTDRVSDFFFPVAKTTTVIASLSRRHSSLYHDKLTNDPVTLDFGDIDVALESERQLIASLKAVTGVDAILPFIITPKKW
jgi:hypothetical protein